MNKTRARKKPTAATVARRGSNLHTVKDADIERAFSDERLTTQYALLFHMHSAHLKALTFHTVSPGERGGTTIMPGRILSPSDEMTVLKLLTRPATDSGLRIIPEQALYCGDDHTLWWMPSFVGPMLLHLPGKEPESRLVKWPPLVLLAKDRTISLAALARSERPDAGTQLYHAPIGNVYSTGEVCLGDCRPPESGAAEHLDEWNTVVYDSAFSHSNNTDAMKGKDAMEFWVKKRRKPTPVPLASMVPLKLTLAQWYAERIAA